MDSSTLKRIAIVHASPWKLYRDGLKSALLKKENIKFIGEAENGIELLKILEQQQPDGVILDIRLADMDAIQLLPIVKHRYPHLRVIILTMFNKPAIIVRMLELGANAYLTCNADTDEIYDAITSNSTAGIFFSQSARNSLAPSFETYPINDKQLKILELVASNLTENEIAAELNISARTVRMVIDKLMNMARVLSVEKLLTYARQKNLIKVNSPNY